jgi:purine-binding chemotaxis protein CheW
MSYLIVSLDSSSFALDINKVKEVLDCQVITKIPQSANWMVGVINLRGTVVSVIDLRNKMFHKPVDNTGCIVVVEKDLELIGLLVDQVEEVKEIDPNSWEIPPRAISNNLLEAVAKVGEDLVFLLTIDRILA